jgi:hypothetical protein
MFLQLLLTIPPSTQLAGFREPQKTRWTSANVSGRAFVQGDIVGPAIVYLIVMRQEPMALHAHRPFRANFKLD